MSTDSRHQTKQRPYLLRAMHEWMADNNLTPHIVVDANAEGLRAPAGHETDGKLVLNVSYTATRGLSLGNELVCFEARFNGVPKQVSVPIEAVLGIYARETGQGMVFSNEDATPPEPDDKGPPDGSGAKPESRPSKPALKIVK
jgi:stringent starvation protein B